jgi:hypothetical protein
VTAGKVSYPDLRDALAVPERGVPTQQLQLRIDGGLLGPQSARVNWANGAYLTMRYRPEGKVVLFEKLCSSKGREGPTGLLTHLCETLPPVFKAAGVEAGVMETAEGAWATDKLFKRGEWVKVGDFYMWWLRTWSASGIVEATRLIDAVRSERA